MQGPTGSTGPTGPTGPTGSLGPTGIAGASGGVKLYSYDACFTTSSNIAHAVAVSFKVLSHVNLNVSNNAQDIIDILNLEDVSHDGVSCHGYVKDCGEAF